MAGSRVDVIPARFVQLKQGKVPEVVFDFRVVHAPTHESSDYNYGHAQLESRRDGVVLKRRTKEDRGPEVAASIKTKFREAIRGRVYRVRPPVPSTVGRYLTMRLAGPGPHPVLPATTR